LLVLHPVAFEVEVDGHRVLHCAGALGHLTARRVSKGWNVQGWGRV
jgi:hypothetical protein